MTSLPPPPPPPTSQLWSWPNQRFPLSMALLAGGQVLLFGVITILFKERSWTGVLICVVAALLLAAFVYGLLLRRTARGLRGDEVRRMMQIWAAQQPGWSYWHRVPGPEGVQLDFQPGWSSQQQVDLCARTAAAPELQLCIRGEQPWDFQQLLRLQQLLVADAAQAGAVNEDTRALLRLLADVTEWPELCRQGMAGRTRDGRDFSLHHQWSWDNSVPDGPDHRAGVRRGESICFRLQAPALPVQQLLLSRRRRGFPHLGPGDHTMEVQQLTPGQAWSETFDRHFTLYVDPPSQAALRAHMSAGPGQALAANPELLQSGSRGWEDNPELTYLPLGLVGGYWYLWMAERLQITAAQLPDLLNACVVRAQYGQALLLGR